MPVNCAGTQQCNGSPEKNDENLEENSFEFIDRYPCIDKLKRRYKNKREQRLYNDYEVDQQEDHQNFDHCVCLQQIVELVRSQQ